MLFKYGVLGTAKHPLPAVSR